METLAPKIALFHVSKTQWFLPPLKMKKKERQPMLSGFSWIWSWAIHFFFCYRQTDVIFEIIDIFNNKCFVLWLTAYVAKKKMHWNRWWRLRLATGAHYYVARLEFLQQYWIGNEKSRVTYTHFEAPHVLCVFAQKGNETFKKKLSLLGALEREMGLVFQTFKNGWWKITTVLASALIGSWILHSSVSLRICGRKLPQFCPPTQPPGQIT